MNKVGFLRIVEASISIMLIAGVLLFFFVQTSSSDSIDLSENARNILEEMAKNKTIREIIVSWDNPSELPPLVVNFLNERIPGYISYDFRVCEIEEVCGVGYKGGEVFSAERIFSSTIGTYNPKKARLFLWVTE